MRRFVAVALILLPLLLLGKSLLGREAFLPADLLQHVAPWEKESPPSAWNVLRYDGITQFYPWRLEASRQFHAGKLPLSNPYAFAADGGTPLWANSQSAPLYPLNALFWLAPTGSLWYVFGLSVALHLLIAAAGVYRLARRLGLRRAPGTLSAISFVLSGPVVCWLALPTFLCVICWLPWLLLAIERALAGKSRGWTWVGLAAGLILLGGHLQIAFYGIATGLVWLVFRVWDQKKPVRGWLLPALGVLLLGICLASPQVLPTVELSRNSHRASATGPTLDGYKSYVGLALPLRSLITFVFPNYYGHPIDGSHWNDSEVNGMVIGGNNYAEWACYVGIAPLILALAALFLPWKKTDTGLFRQRRPLAVVLGLSLSMALGTPLDLLLYFGLPGFAQTGSPARVLVVAALALALLAGVGLQCLNNSEIPRAARQRAVWAALVTALLVCAISASLSASWVAGSTSTPLGELLQAGLRDVQFGLIVLVLAVGVALVVPRLSGKRQTGAILALLLLTSIDLIPRALRYNPGSPPEQVYPTTPGLAYLKANAKGALIAPLNAGWSMGGQSPHAILPPNALTVFELRDAAGYDSLFPASRRERLREAGGGKDPAPPQNGNMAFIKSFTAAQALGARFIVVSPAFKAPHTELREVYSGPDMTIFDTGINPLSAPPSPTPSTALRVGLFLGGLGLAALAALLFAGRPERR